MKRILLLLLLLVTASQGFSQTKGISYQAVILNPQAQQLPGANAQNNILANSTVAIQFTVVNAFGTEEFQEQHTTRTDRYGMINLLIGTGTPTSSADFTDIFWDGTTKKLKVAIDFNGGSNFSALSEQNLTYMPQPPTEEVTFEIASNSAAIATEKARAVQAEQENAKDISTLKAEQATQNTAIALNTVKVGITIAQATTISNTTGINSGDQDISGIAINAGVITNLQGEQTTQNTSIALNTAKTGITTLQATAITNNSGTITTLQGEQNTQNIAIALNTAKTGITTVQASEITANSLKTGITTAQATTITNNAAAITNLQGEQTTQNTAITLNTAKTGITVQQASEIALNTAKVSANGSIATHADVITTNPAIDEVLTYNGSAWVNQALNLFSNLSNDFIPTWDSGLGKLVDGSIQDSESMVTFNSPMAMFIGAETIFQGSEVTFSNSITKFNSDIDFEAGFINFTRGVNDVNFNNYITRFGGDMVSFEYSTRVTFDNFMTMFGGGEVTFSNSITKFNSDIDFERGNINFTRGVNDVNFNNSITRFEGVLYINNDSGNLGDVLTNDGTGLATWQTLSAIDATKLADGSVSNTELQQLGAIGSLVVGISDVQTLTNKIIDANNNTITNIANNTIKAGAAIDATKIANGTVSNTEFQYLNSVTSGIVGITDTQTLTNKTLTSPVISTISNSGTLTLPTSTTTLVGRETTDILINKTINASNNTITGLTKADVGLSNVANTKINLSATTAPTATDDSVGSYSVGSRWIDVTNGKEYVCVDATATAAVWLETAGGSSSTYAGTSTTSINLGSFGGCNGYPYYGCASGTATLTTTVPLAYTAGMRVRVSETTNPTLEFLEGVIQSYDGEIMVIAIDTLISSASGTFASWTINLGAGLPGVPGMIGQKGEGYGGTSTTSNEISLGAKTFTLDNAYYAYSVGMRVRFANSATNYVEGIVTLYDNSLYDISIEVDHILGAGTFSDWTLGIAGDPGDAGAGYTIGLSAEQGGYIFWVSTDGKHGLVAETIDQSISSDWYNAQDVISNPANHSADGQNFRDWRLPTKFELNEMFIQRAAIGGITSGLYWSSTEANINYILAWFQNFFTNDQNFTNKTNTNRVRAVRAF